ncbi:TRAP transporter small permease [Tianweitania sediminis]|uniref:TRAP transporter small permease protein n=1 Tax=Tianweitania sediminis TaxID=1502156 RepID=A0A8J7QY67_9HYPH|nr:TRAP transporter small permease [Tianweitania sediminis]MBP0437357.1 TRAP transporter small permease [Tianweitania sediminis]
MKFLSSVMRGTSSALSFVASILVMLLILHVSADVVMRGLFNAPIKGTIELVSYFYMIGITFLALAMVERRDAHISVEVVTELLPKRVVHVLIVLATVLAIIVLALMCWRSWIEAMSNFRRGSALIIAGGDQLPVWPSYFMLPIGFGVATLASVYKLLCLLTGKPFEEKLEAASVTVREDIENV